MKRSVFILGLMLALAPAATAQDEDGGYDIYRPVRASEEWKPNPQLLDHIVRKGIDYPQVSIGRVRVIVRSPIVETFRRPGNWSDLSTGEKLMRLPIVNLFVPQKMPRPPGGAGRYFAWGESGSPWVAIASGASPVSASYDNPMTHEPRYPLGYFAW